MKNISLVRLVLMPAIATVALFTAGGVSGCVPAPGDTLILIRDGGVESIELNMDANLLEKAMPAGRIQKDAVDDGDESANYKVTAAGSKQIMYLVETLCADICVVSRILVYAEQCRTQAGVGPGMTLADIRAKYTVREVVGGEDNHYLVYVKELRDIAFAVKASGEKPKAGKPYEPSAAASADRIVFVLIF